MTRHHPNLYRLNETLAVESGDASRGLRIVTVPAGAVVRVLDRRDSRPAILAEWDGEVVCIYDKDLRDHATALNDGAGPTGMNRSD